MTAKSARHRVAPVLAPVPAVAPDALELAYEAIDWTPAEAGGLTDAIYEPYALQSLRIPDAKPHPTPLVQSAAMASVAPPRPSYRPIRSEEHTSELQSLMRISYAVFCLKKKTTSNNTTHTIHTQAPHQ